MKGPQPTTGGGNVLPQKYKFIMQRHFFCTNMSFQEGATPAGQRMTRKICNILFHLCNIQKRYKIMQVDNVFIPKTVEKDLQRSRENLSRPRSTINIKMSPLLWFPGYHIWPFSSNQRTEQCELMFFPTGVLIAGYCF